MSFGDIKDPTIRKVLNRGWRPIAYHQERAAPGKVPTFSEHRNGWIIERTEKYLLIRLVGDETNSRVPLQEERWMRDLAPLEIEKAVKA
jgi:hypothetical protein